MSRISEDILTRIRNRWRMLDHGEKTEYLRKEAERLGISFATLYRKIKVVEKYKEKESGAEAEIYRDDKLREEVYRVMAVIEESAHAGFGKAMPAEEAIKILETKGIIRRGILNASLFWRYVDILGLREGERKYFRTFQAKRSNARWQVDVSALKVLRVVGSGHVKVKGVFEGYYRRKAGEKIDKVWILSVVDDYSKALYAELYIGAGEDWQHVVDGLCRAFMEKPAERRLIYGLPGVIYTDQAGWTKIREVRAGFAKLGIKNIRHEPGHSQAKGKVERVFRTIQERFENVVGYVPGERTFAEIREMFDAWLYDYNKERFEKWVKGLSGELRLAPENVRELFYKRDEREVRRMRIYYGGREFWAPAHLKNGDEIEVFELEGEVMAYDARLDKVYKLVEVEANKEIDIKPTQWRIEYEERRAQFERLEIDPREMVRMWMKGGGRIVMTPAGKMKKVSDIVEKERYLSGEGLKEYFASFFKGGLGAIPDDLWYGGVKEFLDGERTEEEVRLYAQKIKKELEARDLDLQRRRINDVW